MLIIIYLISLLICYFDCRNYYISNKEILPEWVDFLFTIFPIINTIVALFSVASLIYKIIVNTDFEKLFDKFNYFLNKYFPRKLLYKIFLLKKQ